MTKTKQKIKALVLFSGGLDSKLIVKILQEQGINVEAVMYKLLFVKYEKPDIKDLGKIKLHQVDCTKGKLFREYLKIIKKPKHGRGTAMNPCLDCRIFIMKQGKKLGKKIKADFIATGEVLGERPMSQYKQALLLTEKEAGLSGKILRPLSAKLLPETEAEKRGLVDREKLLDIQGRQRKRQIALAKKYKIKYPMPGGGCLLCEKDYSKKLIDLFKHKKTIKSEEISLLSIGRHFRKNWKIILGRNKEENDKLKLLNKKLKYNQIIPNKPGPTGIFENGRDKKLVDEMIKAYSSKDLKLRKKFEKYRI